MSLQINGVSLASLTADPVSPANGDVWFNSTLGKIRVRLGGATKDFSDRKVNPAASVDPGVNDDSTQGYEQESLWFNTTGNRTFLCADPTAGAAVWVELGAGAPIFGSEREFIKDNTESTNATTTYQEKVSITTPSIPAGTYFIKWQCKLRSSNSSREVSMQIDLNNGTQISQAMWDQVIDLQISGSDEQVLSAGIQTIDMDFRAEAGPARTATISDARIHFWRLA